MKKGRDLTRRAVDRELEGLINGLSDTHKIIEQVGTYLRTIVREMKQPNNRRDYSTARRLIDRDEIKQAYSTLGIL